MALTKPLETGIVFFTGIPGSGKSYFCAREMVNVAIGRRPVYTNIPIKLRRMRAYISLRVGGGDEGRRRARYLRSLTRGHFVRFCQRLGKIDALAESILEEMGGVEGLGDEGEFHQQEARRRAINAVEEEDGPPILSGAGANWIPPGSVLFLDELHKWFPNSRQAGGDKEPPELLAYTSMHRHMMHRCYVLTQRAMNVTLSFRAMAAEYIQCRRWDREAIVWRIKAPFVCFRYSCFLKEQMKDGEPAAMERPKWSEVEIPWVSKYVVYRLYDSHTHAGSLEELNAEIEEVRATVEGRTEEEYQMKTAATRSNRFLRWAAGKAALVLVILGVLKLGSIAGMGAAAVAEEKVEADRAAWLASANAALDERIAALDSLSAASVAEPAQKGGGMFAGSQVEPAAVEAVATADQGLTGITRSGVIVDGQSINLGENYAGHRLVAVRASEGVSIWQSPGVGWVRWDLGRRPRVFVDPAISDAAGPPGEAVAPSVGVAPAAAADDPGAGAGDGAGAAPDGELSRELGGVQTLELGPGCATCP